MTAKILLTLTSLLLFATPSFAGIPTNELKQLRENIEGLNRACARGTCKAPFEKVELANLPPEQIAPFQEIATDLAQVWSDTILEGDYHADGKTYVDSITALYIDGKIFAYRIHYFERAWYVGNCEFNPENPESLSLCDEGRITESSYVSADFKLFMRDPSGFVDFISLNP